MDARSCDRNIDLNKYPYGYFQSFRETFCYEMRLWVRSPRLVIRYPLLSWIWMIIDRNVSSSLFTEIRVATYGVFCYIVYKFQQCSPCGYVGNTLRIFSEEINRLLILYCIKWLARLINGDHLCGLAWWLDPAWRCLLFWTKRSIFTKEQLSFHSLIPFFLSTTLLLRRRRPLHSVFPSFPPVAWQKQWLGDWSRILVRFVV